MTITKDAACANFSVILPTVPPNVVEATLTLKYNCTTDAPEVDILDYVQCVDGGSCVGVISNVVTPAYFSFEGNILCDGVYYAQVDMTDDVGTITRESACILINCSLGCDIIDKYLASRDGALLDMYHALLLTESCNDCTCQAMCDIFSDLTQDNTNANGCGCAST